jgi:hypothetical protein
VAPVKRRDREPGQRAHDVFPQLFLADILVEHPQEMADPRPPAVVQTFFREAGVDLTGEVGLLRESGMSIEHIQGAGIADGQQRQMLLFRQGQDANIERVKTHRIDRA